MLTPKPAVGTFVVAMLLAAVAQAQESGRDATRDRLRDSEQRLLESKRRSQQIEGSLQVLSRQREELNARLIDTGRLIQGAEQRMTAIEDRLGKLNVQKEAAQRKLFGSYASISTLLSAMQRMGRNPPPVIVTRRKDALEMVRSAMLMAHAFPHLRERAQVLGGELKQLETLIADIGKQRDDLGAETKKLGEAQAALKSLIEVKKRTVVEQQQQLEDVRKASAVIARNVKSMSELISKLDDAVAEKTGLGAYEQRPRSEDAKVAAAPPPRPPGPATEFKPVTTAFTGKPGRLKPEIPFIRAKAQLPRPAVGREILGYGDKTELGSKSEGVVIETRHGAQVTSPCDGWIVYAGVFRSYGQLLIINAGDGYHVLLAGLSTIDVQVGQFVLASEPVGNMDARRKGKSQDSAPVLYVEFRKEGRPIDPEPWWFKDPRRVQG
ncbi:MAG: hypothetical protein RLZ98_877 [Pseudomonadota bacterium]|jgi:septal ring factor EnvC (AmiA/AmiB activator)